MSQATPARVLDVEALAAEVTDLLDEAPDVLRLYADALKRREPIGP